MDQVNTLRAYGLFDAKVPRYTSYPPANRFRAGVGARVQSDWLRQVPPGAPLSLYIHIPFCRRLCWFCACRTQGTQSLTPVEAYLDLVQQEIAATAALIPGPRHMARLHLGGGTPTLLTDAQMGRLIDAVEAHFHPTPDYEFSVEIDPTEAQDAVLDTLAQRRMTRASIGVQDFDPRVQEAIGRIQGVEVTRMVVSQLRASGVASLNIDLLYGLPYQTRASLVETLEQVVALCPDRLALYGYAHVPHMSKRQAMIPSDALPDPMERFLSARLAKEHLLAQGYRALGIDHFATSTDSLAQAAQAGHMRRNFQGYTDDPCAFLIGFGASAISRFPQGYLQNAVATAAYQNVIRDHGLAAHKGYEMSEGDHFIGAVIDQIMCDGAVDLSALARRYPIEAAQIPDLVDDLLLRFPKALFLDGQRLRLGPGMAPLARVIAAQVDAARQVDHIHSAAI